MSYDAQVMPLPMVLPPLAPGDRMTRDEFERRWEAMPELKHAELIEGVVHMAAALRYVQHGEPHGLLMLWLGTYAAHTPGLRFADNASVRLDLDNEPQPDGLLRLASNFGGQSEVDEDGYLTGAPELVAEVSASSTSFDLHDKLNVYRKHGVREYIVWRVLDREIDWFVLRDGRFDAVKPNDGGVYRCEFFPGLWLDTEALLANDGKQVLETLQLGLATKEHSQYVEMQQRKGRS